MECLPMIPSESIHLSIYSPPFAKEGGQSLYHYSSSERDLANSYTYEQFFDHYEYIVREIERITIKGRMSAVHCMDVPSGNTGKDILADFPGDIIRLHKKCGMDYTGRYHVWKEPLTVRNRTMTHALSHRTIVEDATRCSVASADYVLMFRKRGENPIPVTHPTGMLKYAGEREIPVDVLKFKGWEGKQTENKYSHWIWRQYASAFWDDIRLDRVLPYKDCKDEFDEKHPHALQLDVIERIVDLWSNEKETVLTPFMGVGSEVYGAVRLNRCALGIELKPNYYSQAIKNLQSVDTDDLEYDGQLTIDDMMDDE
jgi:hypothetical protein